MFVEVHISPQNVTGASMETGATECAIAGTMRVVITLVATVLMEHAHLDGKDSQRAVKVVNIIQ